MKRSPLHSQVETLDTLFDRRLQILQKKDGYRFSIDALLLAHFIEPRVDDRIIDLGTGCGIIPLLLLFRGKAARLTAVEVQPSLADLARRNALLNRVASRMKIWENDFRDLCTPGRKGCFDLVVSNPPYRKFGSGRMNPREEKALARHEIKTTLQEVLRAAYHLLKHGGRVNMIYPASRAAELIHSMISFHLEPKRVQFVHSREDDEGRLVLIEAVKEARPQVTILPPLFLYDSAGNYTPAAQELFR